jgi:hypothetical protein
MRASTIDADYNFLKKVGKAKEEGRKEMTKLGRVMKGKAGKTGRRRSVGDVAGKGVSDKDLQQHMETKMGSEKAGTVNDDGEGWTDDEETIDKEVERINRLPLSSIKDSISSRIPSFTFSSKDG